MTITERAIQAYENGGQRVLDLQANRRAVDELTRILRELGVDPDESTYDLTCIDESRESAAAVIDDTTFEVTVSCVTEIVWFRVRRDGKTKTLFAKHATPITIGKALVEMRDGK